MYQESALDQADKSGLDEKPNGTLKAKKRYLIGQGVGKSTKAWSGNTALTAGTDAGEGAWTFGYQKVPIAFILQAEPDLFMVAQCHKR